MANRKIIYQGALNSTDVTTIYTAVWPTTIRNIKAVNTTVSAATLALFHNGATAAYEILPPTSILAGGWAEWDGEIYLEKGDTLRIDQGTAAAITLTIYGEVEN